MCGLGFDISNFIRQIICLMKTSVTTLLREFPKVRRAVLGGETVIVETREGNLRITADHGEEPPLLGCLAGRVRVCGDLTQPTTTLDEWVSDR